MLSGSPCAEDRWQWNAHGAAHGCDWSLQPDDARYMQQPGTWIDYTSLEHEARMLQEAMALEAEALLLQEEEALVQSAMLESMVHFPPWRSSRQSGVGAAAVCPSGVRVGDPGGSPLTTHRPPTTTITTTTLPPPAPPPGSPSPEGP